MTPEEHAWYDLGEMEGRAGLTPLDAQYCPDPMAAWCYSRGRKAGEMQAAVDRLRRELLATPPLSWLVRFCDWLAPIADRWTWLDSRAWRLLPRVAIALALLAWLTLVAALIIEVYR